MTSFRVVIPARFDSSRLPGKALLPLAGKPMLQWVHERARASAASEVIIATDDERIAIAARGFGAEVAMTARTHVSGTDRIAEVAAARGWADADIVVNVQGDEPLIPPRVIDQVAELLAANARADIATLAAKIDSHERSRRSEQREGGLRCRRPRAVFFARADSLQSRCADHAVERLPAARRHLRVPRGGAAQTGEPAARRASSSSRSSSSCARSRTAWRFAWRWRWSGRWPT